MNVINDNHEFRDDFHEPISVWVILAALFCFYSIAF